MARIGLSLRRRRDLDFIRFVIILINCVARKCYFELVIVFGVH
ncbi:hypothetical protein BVRB_1g009030 [Beta vulgaris subsp. vulgaris]|nr:hypothetical protein BVRB_1g009030 [Beta vulgaris subsp. vulgaris]